MKKIFYLISSLIILTFVFNAKMIAQTNAVNQNESSEIEKNSP